MIMEEIQLINEKNSHKVTEGSAKIVFEGKFSEFYNPIQEFNRDLTVTVLRVFSEARLAQKNEQMEIVDCEPSGSGKENENEEQNAGGLRILDALSASGLRAIRFAKEVPGVDLVVANDFSEQAFQTIQRNVQLNGVEGRVKPTHSDAIDLMMEHRKLEKRFHAIDLDPYGSASLFLDSAVQAVVDGGILMVTCTDMAILCGNCPEACFAKYGSIPIRHKSSCHEMALRILLRAIDSHANRHERFIQPLLSIYVDFHIRCFVRVQSGAAKAKDSLTRLAQVFSCARCQSLDFQPLIRKSVHGQSVHFTAPHFASNLVRQFGKEGGNDKENAEENCGKCIHCGCTAIHVGGPIYAGAIHCTEFVHKMMNSLKQTPEAQRLGTAERLEGVLTLVLEELEDRPLCLDHSQLMTAVKCPMPKVALFRSALLNGGFRCSGTHSNPNGLKTDAPIQFVWDICRAWAKKSAINVNKLKDTTAKEILGRKQIFLVNFALHRDEVSASKWANILRFDDNKGKNWAPKMRAAKGNGTRRGGTPKKGAKEAQMPKTPEHYWDIDFPSPGEQVRRGYLTYATSPLFKKQKSHSAPVKRRLVVDFSEEN